MPLLKTTLFSVFFAVVPPISHAFSTQNTESHFPTEPVEGPKWATFEVYSKGLSSSEIQKACGGERFRLETQRTQPYTFFGCTVVSFALRQCHFVYVKTMPEAREHERLHCQGFDHPVGSYRAEKPLAQHWNSWTQSMRQETLTLQRRGIPDDDVVKLVVGKAIASDLAVLKRLQWPSTPQEARGLGWETDASKPPKPKLQN